MSATLKRLTQQTKFCLNFRTIGRTTTGENGTRTSSSARPRIEKIKRGRNERNMPSKCRRLPPLEPLPGTRILTMIGMEWTKTGRECTRRAVATDLPRQTSLPLSEKHWQDATTKLTSTQNWARVKWSRKTRRPLHRADIIAMSAIVSSRTRSTFLITSTERSVSQV